MKRFIWFLVLLTPACTVTLPGMHNPAVEVARIMADAQIRTVEAITRALNTADGEACSAVSIPATGGAK